MLPLLQQQQGGGATAQLHEQRLKRETAAWLSSARLRKVARTSPWLRPSSFAHGGSHSQPHAGATAANDAAAAGPATGQQHRHPAAAAADGGTPQHLAAEATQLRQAPRRSGGGGDGHSSRSRPAADQRPVTTGTVNAPHQWQHAQPQPRWPAMRPGGGELPTASAATQRLPLSQLRPRSVAATTVTTRNSQRAVAALAARPSFGSRAGKTLVLSPELAKYRELVRGMFSLEIPCAKCAGQFARMKSCKACAGTGKQMPEPELLLWRWPHNHTAWGKVVARLGKGWAAALPHEDWIGFKKINNHGSTVLRVGGANLLHNKRLLFEHLLAAGDAVAPYIPETYCVSTRHT